jgi:Polyketide cyclase / dehydrase and lipid transport
MADETTESITIGAGPDQVMAVIADFPAYPEWANMVKTVEVLDEGPRGRAKRVRFTLDAGPISDTYTLDYEWADDGLSVRWGLVRGQIQRAQRGSYVLTDYTLSVDLAVPMIGMLRRKAEKIIIDTALKGLKRRVESGSGASEQPG